MQQLDHARPMEPQRSVDQSTGCAREPFSTCGLGARRAHAVAILQTSEGANLVPTVFLTARADEGELHIAPGAHVLAQLSRIVLTLDAVENDLTVRVPGAQHAVVQIQLAVASDE